MEQNNQENIQKPTLPIKTKIATLLIIIHGLYILENLIMFSLSVKPIINIYQMILIIIIIFLASLPFISGLLIIKRRKIGWWLALIIFIMMSLFFYNNIETCSNLEISEFVFFIIISILLLLDRKNFWKIAT